MNVVTPDVVCVLTANRIEKHLDYFLCDDSDGFICEHIISDKLFRPESYTIGEAFSQPDLLYGKSRSIDNWCLHMITDQMERISESHSIKYNDIFDIARIIYGNLRALLEYEIDGNKVKDNIWNQEFIDILRRVVVFSLTGEPNKEIETHATFNRLAKSIIPGVLVKIKREFKDLRTLLMLSILSGLSGLDLKGTGSACSTFSNIGIQMAALQKMPVRESVEIFYKEIIDRLDSPTPIFEWEAFIHRLQAGIKKFKIVWFPDDYIESLFDLLFIDTLLEAFPGLIITIIPKNGRHGNDSSWTDFQDFLNLKIYERLKPSVKNGRLSICRKGPQMGTVNLRKLSGEAVKAVLDSDLVMIKGCRTHEMIQGGLNKPSFTMQAVCRETSEYVTGLDARESPLLMFFLSPGEYAFYGYKDKLGRTKLLEDNRRINICRSTLEDHVGRRNMTNPDTLTRELQILRKRLNDEPCEPERREVNLLNEKLTGIDADFEPDDCKNRVYSRC